VRIARWILGAALALVLLAVAALLVATLLVNPDRYKGEIESAATRYTGRPLVIEGHLRLSWFPWLGLHTGAARLESAPGVSGPDLIDWRAAQVSVRLLPLLLHRRIELSRIRLRGAVIHLRIDAQGRSNWQDLIAHLRSGAASPGPGTSGATVASLAGIGGLELRDSALDYLDALTGARVRLARWQAEVGAWRPGRPVSLSTRFMLHDRKLAPEGLPVELAAHRVSFEQAPLAIAAPRLSLRVADATLRGSVRLLRRAGRLGGSGALSATVPSVRKLLQTLGLSASLPPDPRALGALSLTARWRYRDAALEVKPLTATIDATRLTGWVARSGGKPAVLRFMLRGNDIDLTRYLVGSSPRAKPFRLPVRALEALHAQGSLELARAEFDGTLMRNIRLQVQ
jgi:AsmA protein